VTSREVVSGIECIKVAGHPAGGEADVTWWVAPSCGYIAIRKDEVRYFKPDQGTPTSQYLLIRNRVTEVKPFRGGIHLPVKVERTVAWMDRSGSVKRLLRRWRFSASAIAVNVPVDDAAFKPSPVRGDGAAVSSTPRQNIGCGYSGLLDFCSLLNVSLDALDTKALADAYPAGQEASLSELADYLKGMTALPVVGYRGTLQDVAELNQPVLAHLQTGETTGHFVVVESIGGKWARILNAGEMQVLDIEELRRVFSGAMLAVDREGLQGDPRLWPRVLCANPLIPPDEARAVKGALEYKFDVSNEGSADLDLRQQSVYPADAKLTLVLPREIPPRTRAHVVVSYHSAVAFKGAWAAVIATNDPLRPLMWLGGT
jgi:hypothetical protein